MPDGHQHFEQSTTLRAPWAPPPAAASLRWMPVPLAPSVLGLPCRLIVRYLNLPQPDVTIHYAQDVTDKAS